LVSQETLLALALEATNDGIWAWHIPSGKAYFSPRYCTMLGYGPDELVASYQTWANLLHPEDLDSTQQTIQDHINNRSESYEVEFRLRTKSGQWLWVLGRGKVIEWDRSGHPERMVGIHVNIDSRKRAEQKLSEHRHQLEELVLERTAALKQAASLLEATFDAIPDILGVQDDQHRIIRYNAAGYRFLNKSHEEVAGKRCYELIGRSRECDRCATSRCYRTKQPESLVRYEKALDAWLDVRAYPILDEAGNLVGVIEHLRDITAEKTAEKENRRLQEQLLRAQKMESLGTLAGGIAHDFNNLLMGIQGRLSIMAFDMGTDNPHLEHIEAVEDYIKGATNLTKQLLGFARGGKYEVKPIDVNKIVQESTAMFGRTKKELQVRVQCAPELLVVEADRRQIENVLLNLYINAWQAMPEGGDLYLKTSTVDLDENAAERHRIRPGRYVRIDVKDTGIGMDEATLQQAFDPFFTTKRKGRGTGLGLASAYGIIINHKGMITAASRVGQGTTFTIYLPKSNKKLNQVASASDRLIKGTETILLVDDEKMIVDVGKALLCRLGYDVVTANNGTAAVDVIQQNGSTIDLVILDMIMPGMDGGKTFDAIRTISPQMPVILSSGYAINSQAERIMRKGCNGFIQKPFSVADLSRMVRGILDKSK
jgi:PAS domain S-box-containing protein